MVLTNWGTLNSFTTIDVRIKIAKEYCIQLIGCDYPTTLASGDN